MAIEKAEAASGRSVQIGDLDLSFWGGLGVKLKDVTVGNPDGWPDSTLLRAENIDVKLQLLPLLGGDYRVDRLILNAPELRLRKLADGRVNYDFAPKGDDPAVSGAENLAPETKVAAALALSFDKLAMNRGHIEYRDDSTGASFELIGLELATALKNPRENFYVSTGKIAVDSLLVNLGEAWPTYEVSIEYQADYDHGRKRLGLHESTLGVNGIEFSLTGELDHSDAALSARGSLESGEVSVEDLFRLLPPGQLDAAGDFEIDGDFRLTTDLEYDARRDEPLSYSGTAILSGVRMARSDIDGELRFAKALLDFKPNNLRVNIEEGTFDGKPLKGHLVVNDFDDPSVNGELAGRLNLAFAQPFLPAEPRQTISGEMDFETKFSGKIAEPRLMRFSGNVKVDQARYESSALPEALESVRIDAYFDNSLTRINTFVAEMPSGRVSFEGRINNLIPYLLADSAEAASVMPSVDGQVTAELNLAMLTPFLKDRGDVELQGHLSADLKLAGKATDFSNFRPRGEVKITQASYRDTLLPEAVTSCNADLLIAPDTITIRSLAVVLESSDFSLSGQLIDPFPYLLPLEVVDRETSARPYLIFELSSHRLDIDRLFPEVVPGAAGEQTSVATDSEPPPMLSDIDGRGRVQLDTIIYSEVVFTNLAGQVYVEDGRIDCQGITGNVYSGNITGSTIIDLSDYANPRYRGQFEATQIEANNFASRFSEFGGYFSGKIDLDGSYDAIGWEPEAFLNSLNMNSDMTMLEGRLHTSGGVSDALQMLAQKAQREISSDQVLKDLRTKIVVARGRVAVNDLTTSLGNMGDMSISGSYGFDGTIEYTGVLDLSQSWSEDLIAKDGVLGVLGGLLTDKSTGRLALPLVVGGTITKPKVEIDFSALTRQAGENLLEDAGGALKGLFKKD
jgi:hypothetical protein